MEGRDGVCSRLVFQRCTKAKLQLKEQSEDEPPEYAVINTGLIVYIAFLAEVPDEKLQKIAKTICHTKVCEGNGKSVSLAELPGDLLLVPHFCLGGRLKGKQFQYHGLVAKEKAELYFKSLFSECQKLLSLNENWKSSACQALAGTYGIRQVLSYESNGPFTHIVEL